MSDLSPVANIWAGDVAASNKAKSHIYIARASAVISAVLESRGGHPVCVNGHLCRSRLAAAIGCSRAVLSQNQNIRRSISEADKLLGSMAPTAIASRLLYRLAELRPPALGQMSLPRNSFYSKIVLARTTATDERYIPTICFADGIHEASADWLRQIVGAATQPSTALQYAKLLRGFLLYCRRNALDWRTINDRTLIGWRDFKQSRGVKRSSINAALEVIFRFYCFCELQGILRYRVGCYDRAELPEAYRTLHFPITAERVYRGQNHTKVGWVTPLLFRYVGNSVGNRQTPTDHHMERLHRLAIERTTGDRDDLILSWVEDTAGRSMEVLQVAVNQIPSSNSIDELCSEANPWVPIFVPYSKSGVGCTLVVSVDTLISTRSYITGARAKIVARFKAENPSYKEPPNLFLSSTTGQVLTRGAVTSLFKRLFTTVGLENANIHRVRAKAALDYVELLLDKLLESGIELEPGSAWLETILQQASLKLGHRSLASLRHYLTVALQRRIRVEEVQRRNTAERAERRVELQCRVALETLRASTKFAKSITWDANNDSRAAALRELAAELDRVEGK